MHRISSVIAVLGLALIAVFALLPEPGAERTDTTWYAAEQQRLEVALRHAEPGSDRAFKLQMKLDRLDAAREGRPQPGFPDEFNRVLWEMRVPSDRTAPEYVPGYRFREHAKAPRFTPAEKSLPWVCRGPGNVAGRARGIIVDPDDTTGLTWFIASVGGGVWHTDDGGSSWTELTADLPNLAIQCLAMAASDHDVIYAGSGESYFNIDTMNGNGIIKSTDGGATWTPLASTTGDPRFNNVSRILVDPTDPDVVVASTTTGRYKQEVNDTSSIFRSIDGGASWTEVHTESGYSWPRIQQLIADPTDFAVQYATVYGVGILKSVDAGQTWGLANVGITDLTGRFEMAISPVDSDYLYAASMGGNGHAELWVSWNGGGQWHETFENGDEPNWLGAQGWYDNAIVCHPTDAKIVYVGGPELWRIELDGVGGGAPQRDSTQMASYSFPHPDHHVLEIVHDAGGWWLLGTNDGGITRTTSEESGFTMPTDGMVTTQFYGVDKRPGASAYAGGTQDNGTWMSPIDPTALTPWTHEIGGDGYETSWHFDDPQKIIGGYQYNGLRRSLDGGLSWSSATNGLDDTGSGAAPFITKIAKSTARPDHIFAVGASGVWRSTDFGGSWELAAINSGDWGSLSSFLDVRVSAADPDVVWAGSRMDDDGDIMVSIDGGATFDAVNDYAGAVTGRISGLAADPHDDQTAYVLFSYAERPKVVKTTDRGLTWTDISGFESSPVSTNGFPDVAIYDLMVFPDDPDHIWVGSEIGLIESLDGGATWGLADNGFPSVGVWKLSAVENEVVVATHGRGIWSYVDAALIGDQVFRPLFEQAVQTPLGDLHLEFNLRSAYDSTRVMVDGAPIETYGPNTPMQTETLDLPVLASETLSIYVRSYKDGGTHDSVVKVVDVVALHEPVTAYSTSLDVNAEDFLLDGFEWDIASGFSNGAMHSLHDYPANADLQAMFLKPVQISDVTTLSFDEIAIVEPGNSGSQYGDSDFWDYVIVEGTVDGVNWLPLIPGYDARDDTAWQNAFNGGQNGSSSMYRFRSIVLNDTFARGQTVLLRWRLYADGYVEGWGWAIDDIEIVSEGSTGAQVPTALALAPNVPNPFNPSTTIAFTLPRDGRVRLDVVDLRGRRVRTLVDESRTAGEHRIVWDGRDENGSQAASGTYLYRLTTSDRTISRKMMLVK